MSRLYGRDFENLPGSGLDLGAQGLQFSFGETLVRLIIKELNVYTVKITCNCPAEEKESAAAWV